MRPIGKQAQALIHALARVTSLQELENWCLYVAEFPPPSNAQETWNAIVEKTRAILHDGFIPTANPAAKAAAQALGIKL